MKAKKILVTIIRALLAVGFFLAGLGKFIGSEHWESLFRNWGYFDGLYLIIGAIEIIGSVLLFIPKTYQHSLYGLTIILLGAATTHIINDPYIELLRPSVFLILVIILFAVDDRVKLKQKKSD